MKGLNYQMAKELYCALKLGTPPNGMTILKDGILTVPTDGIKFKNNTILKNGRNNVPPTRGNHNAVAKKLLEAGKTNEVYLIPPQSIRTWSLRLRQVMSEKDMISVDFANLIPPANVNFVA